MATKRVDYTEIGTQVLGILYIEANRLLRTGQARQENIEDITAALRERPLDELRPIYLDILARLEECRAKGDSKGAVILDCTKNHFHRYLLG